ncbi:MAG: TA system VapC family ribonuclease toxin [Candidatus Limnocylindrales bacterium]
MIVPDANLLLYAVDEYSPHHEAAGNWLEETLSGTETIGFAWVALLAFLRLSTLPKVFRAPLSVAQASGLIESWLAQPPVVIVHPGERHAVLLRELLQEVGTAGNLVTDAHLAALAAEHGAVIASADRDFARFPGVRVRNPLTRT